MDLVMAGTIFASIFAVVVILALSRGGGSEQKEYVSRMMLRPVEGDIDIDITRKRKDHQSAVAIILRQINLLRNLEQTMWQAGIYWRVSDVLLIIACCSARDMRAARRSGAISISRSARRSASARCRFCISVFAASAASRPSAPSFLSRSI